MSEQNSNKEIIDKWRKVIKGDKNDQDSSNNDKSDY